MYAQCLDVDTDDVVPKRDVPRSLQVDEELGQHILGDFKSFVKSLPVDCDANVPIAQDWVGAKLQFACKDAPGGRHGTPLLHLVALAILFVHIVTIAMQFGPQLTEMWMFKGSFLTSAAGFSWEFKAMALKSTKSPGLYTPLSVCTNTE